MEKIKIKETETKSENSLWSELEDENSQEGLAYNFREALRKLMDEPNLYYLKTDSDGKYAAVKKRADDQLIYETDVPSEMEALKQVGIEKKDEL